MIPKDYEERVYAGVLGKIIGVYLGRPFEGWTYERITERFGEIRGYVHEELRHPLVVTDDDISGTFTFISALPDYGNTGDVTPAQIGATWLNYLVERRAVLWWGGMGISTEHTAYIRLKSGIPAPESGSIARNGRLVAEQIGAQIFIDGWAMVAPGDPELAADLARRAGSVSHDGEAVYGAQVVAAMESLAFVEPRLNVLLDTAVSLIPADSAIYRLIAELREFHAREQDWRKCRQWVAENYGTDKYRGVHILPNHALIILALLYGNDSLHDALRIVNTCGWDTDCNSGNVGCLLGIKNGLQAFEGGPDWRGPVADRMFIHAAEGGRGVTDALSETHRLVNIGRALQNQAPVLPKNNARYHFSLPGSVQGFTVLRAERGTALLENVPVDGNPRERVLRITVEPTRDKQSVTVGVATFTPPELKHRSGYGMLATPKLYPGQTVASSIGAASSNAADLLCRLVVGVYGSGDEVAWIEGPSIRLAAGQEEQLRWTVPDTGGAPIVYAGLELVSKNAIASAYLDWLTWEGTPDTTLKVPEHAGTMWKDAWIGDADTFAAFPGSPTLMIGSDKPRRVLYQGTREWKDYRAEAQIRCSLARSAGLAIRVQGLRRYYAALLGDDGKLRLVKALEGDQVLAEGHYGGTLRDETYRLAIEAPGRQFRVWLNGALLLDAEDDGPVVEGGAAGYCVECGGLYSDGLRIAPAGTPTQP